MLAEELGEVVVDDPKAREHQDIHGYDHDPPPDHPEQFAQTRLDVRPAVHGEDGHRGIDGAICQRQIFGRGLQHGSRVRRLLSDHDARRLDGQTPSVYGFIGVRACADVDDGLAITERVRDLAGEARVRLPHRPVSTTYRVVGGCRPSESISRAIRSC